MHFMLLILSLFILPTNLCYASAGGCPKQQCMVVVDAGSTGSRLHVYAFDRDKTNTPIAITEIWTKKVQPGLTNLDPTPAVLNTYLESLFQGISAHRWPVYFYATAGLRLWSKSQQENWHDLVRSWFIKRSKLQLISSETISGSDEGLYGWLAVNYQLGTLNTLKKTVGVLDFGGVSVQIAFSIESDTAVEEKDVREVRLYGQNIKLFVHSFLGLGQNEAQYQFSDSANCFNNQYPLPSGETAKGDAYACEQEVSSLVTAVHQVNQLVPKVLANNAVDNWYVLGGMVNLLKSPLFEEKDLNMTALLAKAQTEICPQTWSQISHDYPTDNYLYSYCFLPAYYHALLVNGYGLSASHQMKVLKTEQNGDWTLGVVLVSGM